MLDTSAAVRVGMRHVFVGTHHKSGTIWLRRIFRAIALREGFRMHRLGAEGDATRATMRIWFSGRSHLPPRLQRDPNARMVHLIRDPRDMLISATRYHLEANEPWLTAPSETFDGLSYQERLAQEPGVDAQLMFEMKNHHTGVVAEMVSWPYGKVPACELRYEDLIADRDMRLFREMFEYLGFTAAETDRALGDVWQHSLFGALKPRSVRPHGTEHIRSGKPGLWRSVFSRRVARAYADRFAEALSTLGYDDPACEGMSA
ncbi:MAG: sulfotransferase domain-containing protein [Pseudomonadota bacterium]